MSDAATSSALDRLDRAIARLERATVDVTAGQTVEKAAYDSLEARHGRLRDRIQQTIEDLDRVIASEGPRA